MGGIRKGHGERALGLDVLCGFMACTETEHDLVRIIQPAPGGVPGVGCAVLIVGADDEHPAEGKTRI